MNLQEIIRSTGHKLGWTAKTIEDKTEFEEQGVVLLNEKRFAHPKDYIGEGFTPLHEYETIIKTSDGQEYTSNTYKIFTKTQGKDQEQVRFQASIIESQKHDYHPPDFTTKKPIGKKETTYRIKDILE